MISYEESKRLVVLLLVAYVTIGFTTALLPGWQDKSILPFYSWFFFVNVPEEVETPALLIVEYNQQALPEPIFFQDAVGLVREPWSAKARELIQTLRYRLDAGDESSAAKLRTDLENNFLSDCTTYQIATVTYHPFERWQHGSYEVLDSTTFSTGCSED